MPDTLRGETPDQPAVCDACGDNDQITHDNGRNLCRTCRPRQTPIPPFTAAARGYVHESITRTIEHLAAIAEHLPDAEILATEQPQTGEPAGTSQPTSRVLAEQGDTRAKLALAAIADRRHGLPALEQQTGALAQQLQALFRGPSAGGDNDHPPTVTASDLAHALKAQARRQARGEDLHHRTEPQLRAPKLRGACTCRGDHRHTTRRGEPACSRCGCLVPPKDAA